jgi:cell wall-associated NlpC family hydrolase
MYAWAAAGVSIPHASGSQPGAGTPVSFSQLMPGDLIFYYSPISHVGMYIGNGQVVHAPHPGTSVQVVSMNLMPMTMAVRIG